MKSKLRTTVSAIIVGTSLLFTSIGRADISDADLAALKDADYATRHAATRRLLADETLSPTKIAAAFGKATTVEQKHRLMTVARHHLFRVARNEDYPTPRTAVGFQTTQGALGLKHEPVTSEEMPQLKQSGVRVRRTLPGFPANEALEVGDLILAIEGNIIPAGFSADQISRLFTDSVKIISAGQAVTLQVHRDGANIEVKVKLAPYNALSGMYHSDTKPTPTPRYEKLWAQYRDEVLLKVP